MYPKIRQLVVIKWIFAVKMDLSVHCLHTFPEVGFENDVQIFGCLKTQFLTEKYLTT